MIEKIPISLSGRVIHITFIFCIALSLFLANNKFSGGYLQSPFALGKEIQASENALYEWNLSKKAPFKYRILFPAIVFGSYQALYEEDNAIGFYYVYYFYSLLFFLSTPVVFYFLLLTVGFSPEKCFGGVLLYFSSPAIYMAFSLPVHTREDLLAFSLLCLGLIMLLRQNDFAFFVICLLGVFCRETLLILPFVYFFFAKRALFYKVGIVLIPAGSWLIFRWGLAFENYDVWEGLRWNLKNTGQVIGFSFLTFHFMWFLAFNKLLFQNHPPQNVNSDKLFFYKSFNWVFFLITATTFLGGIINEIRLLFLMFPWVIIVTLEFLELDVQKIKNAFRRRIYWVYLSFMVIILGAAGIFLINIYPELIPFIRFHAPKHAWVISTLVSLFWAVAFIPFLFKKNFKYHISKLLYETA